MARVAFIISLRYCLVKSDRLLGLQKASSQITRTAKLKQVLSQLRGGGVTTPVGGVNVDMARAEKAQKLEAVQDMFDALMADPRRVLLVLDEVQHLATNRSFEALVYALRGMIDANKAKIRVIYTGSSRAGLQKLFKKRNAPLFSSSQTIDLPEFGRGYLVHMAEAFTEATGRTLDINECQSALKMLKKVPYDFRQVLDQLILQGGTCITAVAEDYLESNNQDESYLAAWTEMKPVDQTVMHWVITGNTQGLYSQEARDFIADLLGMDEIGIHSIQNAVNRLLKNGHLAPVVQGRYETEDPYFTDWILTNVPSP